DTGELRLFETRTQPRSLRPSLLVLVMSLGQARNAKKPRLLLPFLDENFFLGKANQDSWVEFLALNVGAAKSAEQNLERYKKRGSNLKKGIDREFLFLHSWISGQNSAG